eukprot:CAMPEP_0195066368 /NCGR_PEP_ID=MMETSP0448-20130528/11739_1 /TAXON_ID=66468 /ORGANISM="Heterocapsa triquestra, Strain CCMP 448" /LENGTH=457 /DNA_ID=CAMNT_0040097609 /DNA_START=56 /DNA_END=1429 /DNA_ORIENTATION=-
MAAGTAMVPAGTPGTSSLVSECIAFLRDLVAGRRPVAALIAAAGIATPAIYLVLARRNRRQYEYGPVDITLMTAEAAKALKQVPTSETKLRTSLIPDALQDLEETAAELQDAMKPEEELDRRAQALAAVGAPPFKKFIADAGVKEFKRGRSRTLQLNIGLYCNQACTHCHVESSPLRTEQMSPEVVERCLILLRNSPSVQVLDITGGAPEMNKGFRRLVEGAAALRRSGERPNLRIIDRCNLTVLLEPGQEDLPTFLVENGVDIIASLPSYDAAQTDRQRGRKVFERSIEGLRILNNHGYGQGGPEATSALRLDLVFNPPGPFLPPRQELLDQKYRQELGDAMGISFNQLITIANMPVKRFFDFLRKKGTLEGYMDLLVRNFNVETVPHVMCIDHINVGWDGRLFDCDFNQQLELNLGTKSGLTVFDVDTLDDGRLQNAAIRTAAHCFGCTAAQGSS